MSPMAAAAARVVLITGASSGVGRACATRLHAGSWAVYGTSRRPSGDSAFTMLEMNVDDDSSVRRAVSEVVSRAGRIDAVVNNAGFGLAGAVEETSLEEAKAQIETNFFGVLRVCHAVLPIMRAQGRGHLVNISSIAGLVAVPFQALYGASKFAVEGLSEALRMEVRPFGVHVTLVEPGDFRTRFTENRRWAERALASPLYAERCRRAVGVMEADERRSPPPDRVAALVERILNSPRPRPRYLVGSPAEILAVRLRGVLPASWFEALIRNYYKS